MKTQPGSAREGTPARRARVRVQGTVQGVGFRPYVYRLAHAHGLAGYVLNDSRGVLSRSRAAPPLSPICLNRLAADAPPLAVVERDHGAGARADGGGGVRDPRQPARRAGRRAGRGGQRDLRGLPDASCFDPGDRRHRYPFINCTNCGPRFTIVRGIPYDRPLTTMAGFRMCEACLAEYEDPADRRFHAQPNACPRCGPSAALLRADGTPAPLAGARDAVHAAARALASGMIVAVKGVGGYHLACRADDEDATARLRSRKHREDKPFALMVGPVEQAEALVRLTESGA